MFACLALSQSRGALGATGLGLIVACTGWIISQRSRVSGRELWRHSLLLFGLLLACVVVLAPVLGQRVGGADSVIRPLLEHGVTAVPDSPVGLRIQLYALGVETFLQHPWVGIGMRTVEPLIAAHGIGTGHYTPPHLHDIYLQILVSLGLVGALILAGGFITLLHDGWRAYKAGAISQRLTWILSGWMTLLLADIVLDNHLWHFSYLRTTQEVLFGLILAGRLRATK
nr:O-antigen ligase family protein [Oleiagrimonas sp. C23AA]